MADAQIVIKSQSKLLDIVKSNSLQKQRETKNETNKSTEDRNITTVRIYVPRERDKGRVEKKKSSKQRACDMRDQLIDLSQKNYRFLNCMHTSMCR